MNHTFTRWTLALILGAALLATAPARAAAQQFVLAGTDDTKQSFYGAWLTLIYDEAFRRLGYDFVFQGFPAKRAAAMAESGQIDGEIQRVADYGQHHPNLVRVEESHFSMRYAAYAARPMAPLAGWRSLAGSTYRVEYRSGVTLCERALTDLVAPVRLSSVTSVPVGLRKLQRGRTDLFIDADRIVESYLAKDEFRDAGLVKVGMMEEVAFYAFLHKRHALLAPALARVLRDMKGEGLIERFRLQADSKAN